MEAKKGKEKRGKRSRSNGSSGTTAVERERKEVERERRQNMKELCTKLVSLLPEEHCSNPDTLTLHGSLEEATMYIKKLKDKVDDLNHRRSSAQAMASLRGDGNGVSTPTSSGTGSELEGEKTGKASAALVVEVRYHDDSSMDIMLTCSIERPIKIHEVITILEEEGAEICNANHSMAGHNIFHTIHSRISKRARMEDETGVYLYLRMWNHQFPRYVAREKRSGKAGDFENDLPYMPSAQELA